MRAVTLAVGAWLTLGAALAQSYTNPIIEPVAADPTVVRVDDGAWYLFATQDRWDDGVEHYVPIFRSDDLVNWTFVADVFTGPMPWKPEGFLWAPDVSRAEDGWVMYLAVSTWGDDDPCIGMATAAHPEGPWTPRDRPVFCSSEVGVPNSIDPDAYVDQDGRRWLLWGSFHGIHLAELTADGTALAGVPIRIADSRFEAADLVVREDGHYLFLASGSCCDGAQSGYITWVGRADTLTGPYLDDLGRDLRYGGGRVVLFRNDEWVGPGHTTMVRDDAGSDWLIYHAIDPNDPWLASGATRRPALLDRVIWIDGWPVIDDDQGPTARPRPAPIVR